MIPLLRISSARAEHQKPVGVWALVLRAMRANPGRIIVAQREWAVQVDYWNSDARIVYVDRVLYAANRPTTARATG